MISKLKKVVKSSGKIILSINQDSHRSKEPPLELEPNHFTKAGIGNFIDEQYKSVIQLSNPISRPEEIQDGEEWKNLNKSS
jgi:hypothetical protein